MARPTAAERFAQYVDTNGPISLYRGTPGNCWLWTGSNRHGKDAPKGQFGESYGGFKIDGCKASAHRYAYEQAHGPIPVGMVTDHLCRRRNCVRPDHLEVVTQRTNVGRGTAPTGVNARKTECVRGHDLTDPTNVRVTYPSWQPNGMRRCLTCERTYRARKRAAATASITPLPFTTPDTRRQAA
jgi:hypothetical protein